MSSHLNKTKTSRPNALESPTPSDMSNLTDESADESEELEGDMLVDEEADADATLVDIPSQLPKAVNQRKRKATDSCVTLSSSISSS